MRPMLYSVLLAGLLLLPLTANAELVSSVGVDVPLGLGEVWEDEEMGWGVQADVGYSVALPLVSAAGGAFVGYSQIFDDIDLSLTQAMAIARLTLKLPVAGFAEGGIGWGWVRGSADDMIVTHDGLSWLLGGGVEYGIGPAAVGVHIDYNQIIYDDGGGRVYEWLDFGLHARASF